MSFITSRKHEDETMARWRYDKAMARPPKKMGLTNLIKNNSSI